MHTPPDIELPPAAAPAHDDAQPEIAFHDDAVPAFVERQLELLYQCVMTTLARFDIWQAAPGASTYVARRNGAISALFLFRREGSHVTVYNQQVSIPAREIVCFARAVFARYPAASLISFYAIATDAAALPFPFQRHACLEDIALALPENRAAYLASLGGSTRATIKRYLGKVRRDFPSFRFDVYRAGEVTAQQVREIIAFSHARISAKNQLCYHDEQGTERLVRLLAKYGVVGVASIDGRTCGGILCARIGDAFHMMVVAHDPRYDAWRLGKLCCYLSVCDAIEQGGKAYHFGWGRFDYKYQMQGKHKDLYRIELYRSRLHMLRKARRVLALAGAATLRRLKLRVANARSGERFADRCIVRTVRCLRLVRQLLRSAPRKRAG